MSHQKSKKKVPGEFKYEFAFEFKDLLRIQKHIAFFRSGGCKEKGKQEKNKGKQVGYFNPYDT